MKSYWVILSGLCLAGCMASNGLEYQSVATTNLYHIARVQKGMSERQVLQIMHKPYSYESFQVSDDIYDVWFYVTRATALDQTRMVPQNLTPLTFKNGILVGTGYYWYYYAMKAQAEEIDLITPPPPKPKTQTQEDVEFEKALRDATDQKKAPPPKSPATIIPAGPDTPRFSERKKAPLEIPEPDHAPEEVSQVSYTPACAPVKSPKNLVRGMSEEQAIEQYGEPTSSDSFVFNKDVYDLLYFDTVTSKTGSRSIIPQNQTAAVFRNGGFTTMSEDQYYKLKEKACRNCPEVLAVQEETEVASVVAKRQSLHKVQIGMTETEVTNVAGPPADFETFQIDENVYDVWFYDKRPPLTFKNSVLVGTTAQYYNNVRQEAGENVNGYNRQLEQMEDDDSNQNFNYW